MFQEVVTATLDLEDVRSYRGEHLQPAMVSCQSRRRAPPPPSDTNQPGCRSPNDRRRRFHVKKFEVQRNGSSRQNLSAWFWSQKSETQAFLRVKVDFSLSTSDDVFLPTQQPLQWRFHTPEEEIRCGRQVCVGAGLSERRCDSWFPPQLGSGLLAVGLPPEERTGEPAASVPAG